jgi:hypothetical protein
MELDVAVEDPLLMKLGSIRVCNTEFVRVAERVITTAVKVFRTTYNVVVPYLRKRILEVLWRYLLRGLNTPFTIVQRRGCVSDTYHFAVLVGTRGHMLVKVLLILCVLVFDGGPTLGARLLGGSLSLLRCGLLLLGSSPLLLLCRGGNLHIPVLAAAARSIRGGCAEGGGSVLSQAAIDAGKDAGGHIG